MRRITMRKKVDPIRSFFFSLTTKCQFFDLILHWDTYPKIGVGLKIV